MNHRKHCTVFISSSPQRCKALSNTGVHPVGHCFQISHACPPRCDSQICICIQSFLIPSIAISPTIAATMYLSWPRRQADMIMGFKNIEYPHTTYPPLEILYLSDKYQYHGRWTDTSLVTALVSVIPFHLSYNGTDNRAIRRISWIGTMGK